MQKQSVTTVIPAVGRTSRDEEQVLRALVTEYVAVLVGEAHETFARGDEIRAQLLWTKALDVATAAAIDDTTVFVLTLEARRSYSPEASWPFRFK